MAKLEWILLVIVTLVCRGSCSASKEYYDLYSKLQEALAAGENNDSGTNLEVLGDAFFPKLYPEPICLLVQYNILCERNVECIEGYRPKYLWSMQPMTVAVSMLLLSYSNNKIELFGFRWDSLCSIGRQVDIFLPLDIFFQYDRLLLNKCLRDLTTQLKSFSDAQNIPRVNSPYNGFSSNWTNTEKYARRSGIIFTIQVVIVSVFVFFFAIAGGTALYRLVFRQVYDMDKKVTITPEYPLLWGVIIFTFVWNAGPGWLIIVGSRRVYYSMAALIPLLCLAAMYVKKNTMFPIPGHLNGCMEHHANEYRSFRLLVYKCHLCFLSHLIQVLVIWSLFVTFAFFMHYLTILLLSFYIDPIGTLAKLVFVAMVIFIFVINLAVLFTVDLLVIRWKAGNAVKKNAVRVLSVVGIFSILPIIGYLVFILGDITFNNYSQSSSSKIFIVIKSLGLMFVTWYGRHVLIPKKEKIKKLQSKKDALHKKVPHLGLTSGLRPARRRH